MGGKEQKKGIRGDLALMKKNMLPDQWANLAHSERKLQLCHRSISDIHGGFTIDAYAKEANTKEVGIIKLRERERERRCQGANQK